MKRRPYLLALAAATLFAHAAVADDLQDVPADHWARAAIEKVVARGILQPFEKRFYGTKLLNRNQLVVVARSTMRSEQLTPAESDVPQFEDLPRTHWAYSAIQRAYGRGYLELGPAPEAGGTPQAPRFHGEKLVDRYQLAVFVAAHIHAVSPTWTSSSNAPLPEDVPPGHWATKAVRVALESRILEPIDGRFAGERLVDRLQLAVALARLLPD